jgi:hypothetical protein
LAPAPTLVKVGVAGELTHIYDPDLVLASGEQRLPPGAPLCGSGYRSPNGQTGKRNIPQLHLSSAQFVTCVRCTKIGRMNQTRYGAFLRSLP